MSQANNTQPAVIKDIEVVKIRPVQVMPASGCKRVFKKEFNLTVKIICKLDELIRSHVEKLDFDPIYVYVVYLENSSYFTATTIEEVIEYENSKDKRISELEICVKVPADAPDNIHSESYNIVKVFFDKNDDSKNGFYINGRSSSWSFALASDIEDQLKRTNVKSKLPFKKYLYNADLILAAITVAACMPISIILFNLIRGEPSEVRSSIDPLEQKIDRLISIMETNQAAASYIPFFLFPAIIASFLMISLKPMRHIYMKISSSVFNWGDEEERYRNTQTLINRMYWGLIVTPIGGFLILALLAWLGDKFRNHVGM